MPTKEQVHTDKLLPLLMQIEEICNENGINIIAQITLDVSPDDPMEHRTATFIVGGAKDDAVAMSKLTHSAFALLGPEGIARFVEEMSKHPPTPGEGCEVDLGHIGGGKAPEPNRDAN